MWSDDYFPDDDGVSCEYDSDEEFDVDDDDELVIVGVVYGGAIAEAIEDSEDDIESPAIVAVESLAETV